MNRRTDTELAAELHRIAFEIAQPPADLSAAVMRLMASGGSASGSELATILGRRRSTVLKAVRQLAAEGKIRRWGTKWELPR